jgi:hypothetical protein
MAQMDGSAAANARAGKSKDLNARLAEAKSRLAKIKALPYRDAGRITTVEAQIARTQAAINKLADPVLTERKVGETTPVDVNKNTLPLATTKRFGSTTPGVTEKSNEQKAYDKRMAARKAVRLKMLKGGSDETAKYQREKYYKAGPEKPGMSGSYVLDQTTGKWKKK